MKRNQMLVIADSKQELLDKMREIHADKYYRKFSCNFTTPGEYLIKVVQFLVVCNSVRYDCYEYHISGSKNETKTY